MTKKRAIRTGVEIISMPPAAEPPVNNRTGNSGCRSVRGQFSVNAQKAVLFSGTNGRRFSSFRCVLALVGRDQVDMKKPPEIKIVREAYELWEQSGKPDGRDQDFYLQALEELQTLSDINAPDDNELMQPTFGWTIKS